MSNYLWTADGAYIKKNLYEHLNNFTVDNDKFCVQDTCLSKSEMILLKESVANYSIFQNVNNKDILTKYEVQEYIKEIFRIISVSSGDEKMANINKYLAYGLNDIKTGSNYSFAPKYNEINFNNLYLAIPDINITTLNFSEEQVQNIITTNRIDFPEDSRKRYVITNKNITNILLKYHSFVYNNMKFMLFKPQADGYYWKLLIEWGDLISEASNSLDRNYKKIYETNFNSINIINTKETITKIEYMKLIDDLKIISIKNGKYDNNSFKDNIFIKQYNVPLNLEIITKEYFDNVIYQSNNFTLSEISNNDILIELKTRLGVDFISNKHYILDNTESSSIRLLRVKYPNNNNFQWQILFLENNSFIQYIDTTTVVQDSLPQQTPAPQQTPVPNQTPAPQN